MYFTIIWDSVRSAGNGQQIRPDLHLQLHIAALLGHSSICWYLGMFNSDIHCLLTRSSVTCLPQEYALRECWYIKHTTEGLAAEGAQGHWAVTGEVAWGSHCVRQGWCCLLAQWSMMSKLWRHLCVITVACPHQCLPTLFVGSCQIVRTGHHSYLTRETLGQYLLSGS